ncbi:hypothetical protein HDG33_000441 [Paraburkholderia sp. Cpub6]|nr:hypothetical protein [Paraburkholderia sp. Cpub6]
MKRHGDRTLADRRAVPPAARCIVRAAPSYTVPACLTNVATGIVPRRPAIAGIDGPNGLSYVDVRRGAPVGARVAVIGARGLRIARDSADAWLDLDTIVVCAG